MQIQFTYCLYLHNSLEILKLNFDALFKGLVENILTSLCVKSEIFAQMQQAITRLYILFSNFMT